MLICFFKLFIILNYNSENMHQKKAHFLRLLMTKTLKEKDLILKEITKLKKLVAFTETAETRIIILILICLQIEITPAK